MPRMAQPCSHKENACRFCQFPRHDGNPQIQPSRRIIEGNAQRGKDQQQQQNDNNTVNRQGRFLQMMVIKIRHKQHRRCSDRRIRDVTDQIIVRACPLR